MLSPYRPPQGAELSHAGDSALNWYTRRLAFALRDKGVDVRVVAPRHADEAPWLDSGIRILPTYRRGSPFAASEIARALPAAGAPLVHIQHELFAYGGLASAFLLPAAMRATRCRGIRVMTTLHGVLPLHKLDREFMRANGIGGPLSLARNVWRSLLRRIATHSDLVHVHESAHRRWLEEEYGLRGSRIAVIPLGVDGVGSQDPAAARSALSIPANAEVALFFGYLAGYKGIHQFLDDIPALLDKRPAVHIVIAGAVPRRLAHGSTLSARLKNLESHDRVHVLGFVPEGRVATVFSAADVAVLPYTLAISASGPMSLAISHRIPVLLSDAFAESYPDAPGMYQVSHGRIAAAIDRFFEDALLRTRSRDYLAGLAKSKTWPLVASAFASLYSGALKAHTAEQQRVQGDEYV
ncbi:MAG: hypothetical protein DLM53_10780 [Candidatus Eremiobacter antarcticus]|nr:glycosyltransferase [Candidatus Eremiobacteraeota bacterium]PZR60832.1 MAG: hypothetical protein DLM53_10780 [Candidatus Eremiobacter sp. RRmetagenome_bin22]